MSSMGQDKALKTNTEIRLSLQMLEEVIKSLHDNVERISHKISDVLSPEKPCEDLQKEPEEFGTKLAVDIGGYKRELSTINKTLNDIIDRVEL